MAGYKDVSAAFWVLLGVIIVVMLIAIGYVMITNLMNMNAELV